MKKNIALTSINTDNFQSFFLTKYKWSASLAPFYKSLQARVGEFQMPIEKKKFPKLKIGATLVKEAEEAIEGWKSWSSL